MKYWWKIEKSVRYGLVGIRKAKLLKPLEFVELIVTWAGEDGSTQTNRPRNGMLAEDELLKRAQGELGRPLCSMTLMLRRLALSCRGRASVLIRGTPVWPARPMP